MNYYRRIQLIDECFEGCEVCDVDFEDAGRICSCETGAGGCISETGLRTFYLPFQPDCSNTRSTALPRRPDLSSVKDGEYLKLLL